MGTTRSAGVRGKDQRRVGIYVRISKGDEGEGASLGIQRQHDDCRAEAVRRGWDVIDVYQDDDRSAYSGKVRPQYVRLCGDLKARAIDSVIVWDVDRLHRSPRELEDFVVLIEATGAAVVSVSGGDYDLETADGRFKARIMGAVARKESEDKSRRLRRKHAQLADDGKANGGPRPMGYQRVGLKKDPAAGGADTRRLVVVPDEAAIVKEIIERVATGQTLTGIADDLNARGKMTSTGVAWSLRSVRRMALNGMYAGRRIHRGEDIGKGDWDPIVDEATWRRAVALLTAPDRQQRRTPRRYLLSGGILVCGKCGAGLRSKQRRTPKGKVIPSYMCPVSKLGGCGGVTIQADMVEQLVTEAVIMRTEAPTFAKALSSRSGGDRKAAAEVNRIAAELDELEEAKRTGALSLREYVKFRDATVVRLADAQGRMAGDTTASAVGRFAGQAGKLRAFWDDPTTTLDQKQAVIRAVVERVVIAPAVLAGSKVDKTRVTVVPVM
jgi:site-specific DNA recombinase